LLILSQSSEMCQWFLQIVPNLVQNLMMILYKFAVSFAFMAL